jgi:ABC-2 type transport system ATP-binding protein
MAAIQTQSLTRKFDDLTAVSELTLSVEAGEIFGLVGPDGAGKTTTLRLLSSILEPTGGRAEVAGFDVVSQAEQVKARIGYVSQRFGLYADLTVMENLHFYADIYGVTGRERRERIDRLLAFADLEAFRRRRAGDLSGGMKQKLALACALVHTPAVLLLDEPTNGVDAVSRRDFWRILYQLLREGVTIVLATSYMDEAERCSRVGLMHHGKLIACGTPTQIKGLMKGTILEARTAQPRTAWTLLRQSLGGGVGLFGDRVHVVCQNAEATSERIRAALGAAKMEVLDLRKVEPSLEDVFISIVGSD